MEGSSLIKIENTHVDNIVRSVYSARNAMNSWDKSDSDWNTDSLGENDLKLARTLSKAGNDHGKFLRMINVTVDITAPLYWWKEYDTYKVGTVANSCSTMHKIAAKEFTLEDFSCEHLLEHPSIEVMRVVIEALNTSRTCFLECKDQITKKDWWWQMIQLLPTSYNQKRTVQLNYQVLKTMYFARRNHKLDEWRDFCAWCESLPYFKEICIQERDPND